MSDSGNLTVALETLALSLIPGARSLGVVSTEAGPLVVIWWKNIRYTTSAADPHGPSCALALIARTWTEESGWRYLTLRDVQTGSQVKTAMSDLIDTLTWNAAHLHPEEGLRAVRNRVKAELTELTPASWRGSWTDEAVSRMILRALEDVRLRGKPTATDRPVSTWTPEVLHLD